MLSLFICISNDPIRMQKINSLTSGDQNRNDSLDDSSGRVVFKEIRDQMCVKMRHHRSGLFFLPVGPYPSSDQDTTGRSIVTMIISSFPFIRIGSDIRNVRRKMIIHSISCKDVKGESCFFLCSYP